MLTNIARFESRYLLRNPLLWLTAAATFALFFVGMSVDGFDLGNEGGLLKNAAYAMLRNYVVVSVVFMFVTTSFVANAVLRDDETGFGPIIRSTGITKVEYVLGRFLGAFAVAALCMLVVPLATLLGSVMPWAPPAQIGPNRLIDHLYGYFLLALPNLFIHAAVFFALATITRSMMAAYLGVISFVSGFFMLRDAFSDRPELQTAIAVAEPFAGRALSDAVRYWTVAERNVMLPELTGALLYNRLLWVGAAGLCLAFACAAYRFADQGMSRRERKRLKLVQPSSAEAGRAVEATALPLPAPEHGRRALRALLRMRTRFEARQVILSPAFVVVMAWGLYTTFFVLLTQRHPVGRPTYPTTLTLIPLIEDSFRVMLLVVAIFYAGELVWRERDRRVHELVDATPLPSWAYVVPKTLAMALVLMAVVLTSVAASVLFQLSAGFTEVELGKYLLWYVLPATWDMLLLAALAVFVQALSPHKTIGWAVMVVFLLWRELNTAIDHNLLSYGSSPGMPLSDMNGAGSFWWGAWTVRLYWGAFAFLLLVAAHLLWRRGTEIRLRPRLAAARRRLTGAAGWVAGAALVAFAGTGAYAFYNINVLNEYRSPLAGLARQAAFEKKYWKHRDLPQPTVADMTVSIDLYPEERRAVTRGRYRLRNLTPRPITEIHVRLLYDDLELTRAAIAGARQVLEDGELDYHIFRLDSPMRPGEERVLTFETRLWHRGFRNGAPNTRLVENGTFLNKNELTPVIGMSRAGTLEDAAARRAFGLPERGGRAKLEDLSATANAADLGGWVTADITLSTTADQTPIAPGRQVSDVLRGGRRIARFVSEAPIRERFSVQSARYAEKHRRHAGVDLAVYYHPPHAWNVDRMLDALAASLDHYQASFGPYPFDHVRILEYPGYTNFAQAFAGTIPYSETYGFIADFQEPETIDHVTATTAHELAHQWWAHQVTAADMEGSMLLSETLANYSALMMLRNLRGEDELRRALRFTLDRYLAGRAGYGPAGEPPLVRVEAESWIGYQKGALAMYLLQERMGEDAVNRALRNLLHRYKFKGAPYPRSLDLIEALRAEARTAEEQALITDLFERVTLYDLKVAQPTAVRRADGKWDVTVPVEAKKLYVHGGGEETETPLAERIEAGLFTAEPGRDAFDKSNVVLMERQPIRSGRQVLKFVTDRKPAYAGIDPYNFYIDRNSADNLLPVR
ncbi:MAG TPA: ABC transporter permease [Thermoanaerobaculia bacterium]|nr:ABC transporter permease [Thermoanaerobaculia bacterium]